jgi:5'-nucleotidase
MGEDVFYSGTVAAAIEGAMQGAPAIAVSLASHEPSDFVDASRFTRRLVVEVMRRGFSDKRVLNVNLPNRPWSEIQGVRLTRLGTRSYSDTLIKKVDPRGRAYYWIGGQDPVWLPQSGSDFSAVSEGFVSVTPLVLDLTDNQAMSEMEQWNLET